jgi:hypothetical protein
MLRSSFFKKTPPSSATSLLLPAYIPFTFTSFRFGSTQLTTDMPASTTRRPAGLHRGPNKRMVNAQEKDWYQFVKKWELEMAGDWEPNEKFQHLPKPKKLIGNEACEIVWPYAVLLENIIKIHPFTKSIYVYYPQHTLTDAGEKAASLARRFARECMIPICFHNSQCYVESEMLLEHSDTAWIVVHCLDGRHEIVRVEENIFQGNENGSKSQDEQKLILLQRVLETASKLGSSVKQPEQLTLQLNERPLQNGFIRVDYQWMGETAEERQSHLVRWIDPDDRNVTQPLLHHRESKLAEWLNYDDDRHHNPRLPALLRKENNRNVQPKGPSTLSNYFHRYSRISSSYSKATGTTSRDV